MPLTIVQQKKVPNKVLMSIKAQGMEVQKTVSNGAKATMSAMGQSQQIEGKQLEATTLVEALNLELSYDKLGIKKQLASLEQINGKDAYKVEFTLPGGDKFYDYYDATTGLRLRRVSTLDTPQGSINRTTDYDNYKEVNGVKFPFTISQAAGPQQIKMEVQSIEINKGLPDEIFEVK
jgi:zinc protease